MRVQYILLDGEPVPCDDSAEWCRWFESGDRRVASTHVGDVLVSTVFLAINHNYGAGPPLLFETMVFGGPLDEHCERYASRAEAVAGHERVVALVTEAKP